ncbi:Hypothetical predicted protein [Octopus vulgaris]|uniref:Uncharacterized protein n=1 Tax=Octopus vulgaris TaxID=6645 RepID=A0AA36BT21_OCTVU|nr:Hypothetical predicted protein [Octopus vulgaris]
MTVFFIRVLEVVVLLLVLLMSMVELIVVVIFWRWFTVVHDSCGSCGEVDDSDDRGADAVKARGGSSWLSFLAVSDHENDFVGNTAANEDDAIDEDDSINDDEEVR